jgi:hypothetical protein
MSEITGDSRPARKLTVENFSVIKHAELKFGKITVLIGPQASGKSLLCKLAHFLSREAPDLAIERVSGRYSYSEFLDSLGKEFLKWFPVTGWGDGDWRIIFSSKDYSISISADNSESPSRASITFGEEFRQIYETRLLETAAEQQKRGFPPPLDALRSVAAVRLRRLVGSAAWDTATYIPLERAYFVDTQKGYRALAAEADPIAARFAVIFANSIGNGYPKPRVSRFLNGDLIQGPDGPSVAFWDGRFLSLNFLSSGSKEILPIVSVLDYYEHQRRQSGGHLPDETLYGDRLYVADDFTIEEPEASVFPQTQLELVQEIVALSNETSFRPYFTITTHSPYILSVLADLVKAAKVGAESLDHRMLVAKIILEKYWINASDFAAYKIENGKLESIFDEKTGQIDGDYLDDVSGKISDELGKLLEIQYGK